MADAIQLLMHLHLWGDRKVHDRLTKYGITEKEPRKLRSTIQQLARYDAICSPNRRGGIQFINIQNGIGRNDDFLAKFGGNEEKDI